MMTKLRDFPQMTVAVLLFSVVLRPAAYADEFIKPLNDTGIHYGGNYPKGINASCTATAEALKLSPQQADAFLSQQDCKTGSSLTKTPKDAAFSYQKINEAGQVLPAEAKQWQCVTDTKSGLMWEVKHADKTRSNLHYAKDRFTWYNSNPVQNGGSIGDWNQHGAQCFGYTQGKPRSYCHIEQFVSRVNKQGLCGFKDWRLPTRSELTSLIHFGEFQPAIDTQYFPETLSTFYWTASPMAGRPIEAWSINFEFGYASPLRKTDLRPARLVRDITPGPAVAGDQ